MSDNKDFFDTLKIQPEEVENNINLQPSEDDFEDMPEDENSDNGNIFDDDDDDDDDDNDGSEYKNPQGSGTPLSDLVNADDTADIAIMMIDGVQAPIFYILHRNKLVKKYFEKKEDYKIAAQVYALSDADITSQYPEDFENRIMLKRKYNAMNAEYHKKEVSVPLTDEEKDTLKKPMRQLVAKANFEIPPSVALVVAMSNIVISRLIEVYWD